MMNILLNNKKEGAVLNDNELIITRDAVEKLIMAHDGDIALLYLYRLEYPSASDEDAARDLCRTMAEISSAGEKLSRITGSVGKLPEKSAGPAAAKSEELELPEEIPQYTKDEITRRGSNDIAFKSILDTAMQVTGSFLSENFMRILFGLYDHLGLPPEVIMMLLNYCSEVAAGRPGKHRLTARDVEREGYIWYNHGIFSLDSAEEYISRQRDRRSALGRIKAVVNISGRELTATEQRYISEWLNMGFSDDAVAIAYDRTVTNTGSLKWGYMNKILLSWNEKKLHTAAEIEAGDGRRKPGNGPVNTSVSDISPEELAGLIDRI